MTSRAIVRPRLARALLVLLVALASGSAAVAPASAAVDHRPDLLRHFEEAGATGTMVVERHGEDPATVVVGVRRSHVRYLPSSTFKIPNTLIALDRGVVSGPEHPFPGPNPNVIVDGEPLLPRACEGDLSLASAFAFSCIPIYQRIARQVGLDAYRDALRALRYGNRRADGAPIDRFWLEGPLGISAHEQVDFLSRLRRGALPVSWRARRIMRDMMVVERTPSFVLRGKTGYVFSTSPRVGWWVGSVERGGRSWTFALNIDMTRSAHFAARTAIGRAILRDLGALDR